MKKRSTTMMQVTQYSVFPALMVVREEDNGRRTIHPIPLEMMLLLKWLRLLLIASPGGFGYAAILFRILLEVEWLVEDVRAALPRLSRNVTIVTQRITLELKMGTILTRQLTLGVLNG
ncbi:MAG: hypothetical protein GY792_15750 [Gammaproteobacteria bacterium]|nr:hypothetical protein [Gammaproteobacteria bacterium]